MSYPKNEEFGFLRMAQDENETSSIGGGGSGSIVGCWDAGFFDIRHTNLSDCSGASSSPQSMSLVSLKRAPTPQRQ
ncbi:hypothetical protein [Rhodoferax sp.]|uniref:hypothetical protein n=1 Tax=Rhodoferax sp. TaxID=50421 RepID=UPI00284AB0F2|nr:hypothetical protein [Rhodoferax sp.]MDR3368159.1 hypothetical protein [Rhodoferax sp.]